MVVVPQEQQRSGRARRVEALQDARERRPFERPGQLRLPRIVDQALRAPLDVAPFPLLRRIAQAGLGHRRRRRLGRRGRLVGHRRVWRRRRQLGEARRDRLRIDGRRQVVGGREPPARLGAVAGAAMRGGDEDDWHGAGVGLAAQLLGQTEAVAIAEAGPQHHRVRPPHGDAPPGPGPLRLGGQLVARIAQRGADAFLQLGIFLDDEDVPGHRDRAVYQHPEVRTGRCGQRPAPWLSSEPLSLDPWPRARKRTDWPGAPARRAAGGRRATAWRPSSWRRGRGPACAPPAPRCCTRSSGGRSSPIRSSSPAPSAPSRSSPCSATSAPRSRRRWSGGSARAR